MLCEYLWQYPKGVSADQNLIWSDQFLMCLTSVFDLAILSQMLAVQYLGLEPNLLFCCNYNFREPVSSVGDAVRILVAISKGVERRSKSDLVRSVSNLP